MLRTHQSRRESHRVMDAVHLIQTIPSVTTAVHAEFESLRQVIVRLEMAVHRENMDQGEEKKQQGHEHRVKKEEQ